MNDIRILHIEDNPGDVILTGEAFRNAGYTMPIRVARDGEEALNLLFSLRQEKGAQLPNLILLDINLPRVDGKEVLRKIKEDATLRRIPVIMLTSSSLDADINECYRLYASCYVVKPIDLIDFLGVVEKIESFWTRWVQLPQ